MNYRHAYHAGNFADVVKHAVLTRLIEYLKQKDKAFRVIDTHAGTGLYDLSSAQAQKTGEWRGGIGKVMDAALDPAAVALLAPYLAAVRNVNGAVSDSNGAVSDADGGVRVANYPGSPLLARRLMRNQDRLTAIELHPDDCARLRRLFDGDFQARVIELDGWLALGAHLPPKEKRGLVLVDPPFEEAGEFGRMADGVEKAHRRWPGGIYALWYPIKDREAVAAFRRRLARSGIPKLLDIAFEVGPPAAEPRLHGSGMVVANPPFTLEGELATLLPALHGVLARENPSRWTMEWLAGENPAG